MAPTSGIAKLGLEGPAIGSIVDEFGRIVLTRWGHQFDTDSDNGLLPPFRVLLNVHSWAAFEVHGKAKTASQEARAVRKRFCIGDSSPEVSNTIRQGSGEVGRSAEKVHGVGKA